MNPKVPRTSGRPYGGICIIISRAVAFQIKYRNERCLSILLTDQNVLFSNVYLPYNNTRISSEENLSNMSEALGHLEAAHDLAIETSDYITVGDFNVDPNDRGNRAEVLKMFFSNRSYNNSDLSYLSTSDHSHSSGRTLDRIMSTLNVSTNISHIYIDKKFRNSDHYPVVGKWSTSTINSDAEKEATPVLLWKKASEKALLSYSRLSQKLCSKSLVKFKKSEIDGIQLYSELIRRQFRNSCKILHTKVKSKQDASSTQ